MRRRSSKALSPGEPSDLQTESSVCTSSLGLASSSIFPFCRRVSPGRPFGVKNGAPSKRTCGLATDSYRRRRGQAEDPGRQLQNRLHHPCRADVLVPADWIPQPRDWRPQTEVGACREDSDARRGLLDGSGRPSSNGCAGAERPRSPLKVLATAPRQTVLPRLGLRVHFEFL